MIDTSTMTFWNRYGVQHHYNPPEAMKGELNKWPKNLLINAELLHYHTKNLKDTLIVHCIMVHKKPLIGKTWEDSRKIIEQLPYGNHVKLSRIYTSGFWEVFEKADGPIIEGIILKKLKGPLILSARPLQDVPVLIKFRKPCNKYHF